MISDKSQIDGQFTFDGENIFENEVPIKAEERALIIEEDGTPVQFHNEVVKSPLYLDNTDLEALELLKPDKFDIRNFHSDFKDNTKRVLLQLLAMQSNTHPLKKGGEGIAYRCDALILQNRQHFTDIENTLLDVFLGTISSAPDDKAYFIYPKDVATILELPDETYAYKLLKKAVETLSNKPLKFMVTLDSGKQRVLKVPWYEALSYIKEDELDEGESVGIAFTPTDFFKMITISSTISHGAHYLTKVAYSIPGQYAKVLFHYIESKKHYCAYPNATPGWFKKTVDEIKEDILGCPASYRWGDINRRAFKVVKDIVNNRNDVDFVFDYDKKGNEVFFMISKKVEAIEVTDIPNDNDADKTTVIAILTGHNFSNADAELIYKHYKSNSRDIVFLTQALTRIAVGKNIRNRKAVLCSIMDNGLDQQVETKKNTFHNFNERERDFDELEKVLLSSKPRE